ncbi:CDP-diacylglycerol-serine O-phosphatidyltransferase [Coemansia sp. RSA 2673]|nr:CDP-diacylglycerol-serine O-phosphatidyltransferase [Coemansia sp. RSA 2673]
MPKDSGGKVKFFEGTPIPTTLIIVGVLAQAFTPEHVWGGEITLFPGYELHPLVLMYGVSGTLMISRRLRIPKL